MKPDSYLSADAESSRDLQALLDAGVEGIIFIDHLGTIEVFNRSAEQLFGYGSHEVVGRNVRMLMTAKDHDAHDAYLARYVADRVPHIIGKGREVTAQRKDGSAFPAFLSVGAVPGAEPPRFVGMVHDISARRRAEQEGMRLQDRLMHVSRLATVGEMASGIAHELNQPLAAIATYAHACDRLLGAPHPEVAEIQSALREIASQAVRAGDIIRRLRGLARDDETQRGPADINGVIMELTDLIHSDAKAHGVQYHPVLAPDLPTVTANRAQIQQVVMNLVRNALEALALGQLDAGEVVVRTRMTDEGDVEICVCDNGPGVGSEIADRMFDPFCSTKPAGTGLGLAISRTIIQTHGGAMHYRPNAPNGACFSVLLPSRSAVEP